MKKSTKSSKTLNKSAPINIIESTYTTYRRKHNNLPTYDSLNDLFEISTMQPEGFLLRNIKRKMAETMDPYLTLLEHMISPDPHQFTDLYESSCFTPEEKKQLFHLYRHLMEEYRAILETNLLSDEKTDAKLIRAIHDKWKEDRKHIAKHIHKLRQFWHKHVAPKQVLEYLG